MPSALEVSDGFIGPVKPSSWVLISPPGHSVAELFDYQCLRDERLAEGWKMVPIHKYLAEVNAKIRSQA